MKSLLTRYSYKYPAVLVYMLQASEYYINDYLHWYHKTSDFGAVERAGKLRLTAKAKLLLLLAWIFLVSMIIKVVLFSITFGYAYLLLLLLVPFFLAYLMIIPVFLINIFIQKPLELIIANKLKATIAAHPATKIAIAGSYGKTTMREILKSVLSIGRKVAAPGGSLNTLWGINSFVKGLTGDEEVLIFELGEYYPGDVARLCRFVQPDIGFITGINEAHLDRMKTLERTTGTIYELADYLGDKPLYINGENKLAKAAARGNYKLYSEKGCGDTKVESAVSDLTGTKVEISRKKTKLELQSKLLGLHLVGSIVAAAELAFSMNFTDEEVQKGVAATKPFSRRLELVSDNGGIVTLDDSYNGNPDGVKAVIDFLASLKGFRRLYITSGLVEMGDHSHDIHVQIGKELAEAGIEKVLLVKNSVTPLIAEGLNANNFKGEIMWFDSTTEAYNAVSLMTVKGDVVLMQTDWPDQYK